MASSVEESSGGFTESQEMDFAQLVDVFGDEHPPEDLRQRIVEQAEVPDRVAAISEQILDSSASSSDTQQSEDNVALLRQIFPDHPRDQIEEALHLFNGSVTKAGEHLSAALSPPRAPSSPPSTSHPPHKRKATEASCSAPKQARTEPLESHSHEQLTEHVQSLIEQFPDANADALFHRLEASVDLAECHEQLVAELAPPEVEMEAQMSDLPGPSHQDSDAQPNPVEKLGAFLSQEDKDSLMTVVQIFPDVDPHYVFEQVAQLQKTKEELIDYMSKNSGYPKLKLRMEKERRERRRQKFLAPDHFNSDEFLRMFSDPEEHFANRERTVSKSYIDHAKVYLMNRFPNMREDFLVRQLELNNNVVLAALRAIMEGSSQRGRRGSARAKRKPKNFNMPQYLKAGQDRQQDVDWPDVIDEPFFRELQYITHEDTIKARQQEKTEARERRMEEARENGQLKECQCCFSDDCLPEEMLSCQTNEEHKFCRECVRQHAETRVGDGQYQIACMDGDCEGQFSLRLLQPLVRPNTFNLILRRWQQDELRTAQLDNLETCPFCDFVLIIENPDEKVFRCQNPDCLKESCRECKEESHIPLRCNEVEKDAETRMRTFIENKMAEAMIRICPKCKNRLVKSDGCNKMTCPCGAKICYVCKQQLTGHDPYSHFRHGPIAFGPGGVPTTTGKGCPLQTTIDQVHADVAEKAGKEAKEQYLKDHPELQEANKVKVNDLVDRNRGPNCGHAAADAYDSDSDRSDDDEDMNLFDDDDIIQMWAARVGLGTPPSESDSSSDSDESSSSEPDSSSDDDAAVVTSTSSPVSGAHNSSYESDSFLTDSD